MSHWHWQGANPAAAMVVAADIAGSEAAGLLLLLLLLQVVVRTAGRAYRVSQMAQLLKDVGDAQLVRRPAGAAGWG
jgi:hypothetical protein